MAIVNVTLNPDDKNGSWNLSNGNLTATFAETTLGNIRATHGKITGKWYWEVKLDSGNIAMFIGIANKQYPITDTSFNGTGNVSNTRTYYGNNGNKNPEYTTYSTGWSVGDVIGVALDLDIGTLEFYKNGISMGISHTNLTGMGEVYPFFKGGSSNTRTFTVNFGATPFVYSIPTGFTAYNRYNVNKFLIQSESGEVESFDIQTNGKMLDSVYKGTGVTLSNNNRTSSMTGYSFTAVGDKVISKGKYYWEVKIDSDIYHMIGVIKDGENLNSPSYNTGKSRTIYTQNGQKWNTSNSTYGTSLPVGTILSVLLDMDIGTIEFWKSGVSQGLAFTDLLSLGSVRPSTTRGNSVGTGKTTFSFIESDFTYEVPEGYKPYGADELLKIKSLDSSSESTFIEKGINNINEINPMILCTKKQYIKSQNTTLGTGKTYDQPINLSKYKVNKITFQ